MCSDIDVNFLLLHRILAMRSIICFNFPLGFKTRVWFLCLKKVVNEKHLGIDIGIDIDIDSQLYFLGTNSHHSPPLAFMVR